MIRSPLQLEGYFFSRVEVRAHADGDPEVGPTLQTVSRLSKDSEEEVYLVTLQVELTREESGKNPTYTGLVEVRGFFRTAPGYPAERCDEMVYVNGSTMLYGAAREMLTNLTSRGPWPGVTLPSVRFVNEDQEAGQADVAQGALPESEPAATTKLEKASNLSPAPKSGRKKATVPPARKRKT